MSRSTNGMIYCHYISILEMTLDYGKGYVMFGSFHPDWSGMSYAGNCGTEEISSSSTQTLWKVRIFFKLAGVFTSRLLQQTGFV
ncbi:hypothetical protein V6N13_094460 [Hibiscus sabdariffa]